MKKKNLLLTFLLATLVFGGGAELFAQKTLPYSYGFEFTLSGSMTKEKSDAALNAEGWTLTNESSNTMIKTYMYNNSKSFCFYVDESKDYQYLVSPLLPEASSLNIQFYWKTTSSTTVKYQIGYSTSDTPDVATNFTWSDPITATWYSSWTLGSESFLIEGIQYVAIRFDRNTDTSTNHYFAIDNVTISIAPPSNIVASPMTTLATLSWTAGYNESNWLLYYSTTNTAPTDYTTNVISVNTNPTYTTTGLTKDETYYAWVCAESNGIYSAWVGPVEFTPADEFTLTVYNGTATQTGVPFFYNTTNNNVKSQFIIPSTELSYLINKQITDLQFYHTVANQSWGDAKFEIYIKEFDSKTTFSSTSDYTDWSTMTKVYDGNAVFSTDANKIMDIALTNPYIYTGGNLMIGFKIISTGNTVTSCYWNGVSQSTAENNTCICYTTYNTGYKWLPKITFTSQCITFDNCNWGAGATPTTAQNVEVKNDVTVVNGTNAFANIIEMASGSTFTIGNGATLTCNNIAGTTTANFVIEDGGNLICNNNVNATISRTITPFTSEDDKGHWYLIASPMTDEYLVSESGLTSTTASNYDLYIFDQYYEGQEWRNYKETGEGHFTHIKNKVGYLYASAENTSVSFTGTLNNTDGDINLTKIDGKELSGMNLIGNPYPCQTGIGKPFYRIVDNDGVSEVMSYPAGTLINPMEGIIVEAENNGETVAFTKAVSGDGKGAINLNLGNSDNTLDRAIVSFNDGSKLTKFMLNPNNTKIYIPGEEKDYAVVNVEAKGEMPVNFKAAKDGQYTISVNVEETEMNYLHLIDNMTGSDIDLLATPSYTFNAKSDDYASRFRLVFSGSSIEETVNEEQPFAFISNGEIIINGTGTVQAFDMLGRQLFSHQVNSESSIQNSEFPTAGVYVLQLTNNENTRTQKIVIR